MSLRASNMVLRTFNRRLCSRICTENYDILCVRDELVHVVHVKAINRQNFVHVNINTGPIMNVLGVTRYEAIVLTFRNLYI